MGDAVALGDELGQRLLPQSANLGTEHRRGAGVGLADPTRGAHDQERLRGMFEQGREPQLTGRELLAPQHDSLLELARQSV